MERIEKKVIIDPYRGGEDIGSNIHGIIEKNYNLDLSKYIYKRLKGGIFKDELYSRSL